MTSIKKPHVHIRNHLDLGSGQHPRNPLLAESLVGLDLKSSSGSEESFPKVLKWNAVTDLIPFPDCSFSSCSAFDFLEHVPRIWSSPTGDGLRYPFVDLMSEIFRILEPGGIFLAASPVYPTRDAFSDPTHINFLTRDSHRYFCGPNPWARVYGFQGEFNAELIRVGLPSFLYGPVPSPMVCRSKLIWRWICGRPATHLLWKFKVVK
jgi:SAM-dependent methyltransferase